MAALFVAILKISSFTAEVSFQYPFEGCAEDAEEERGMLARLDRLGTTAHFGNVCAK